MYLTHIEDEDKLIALSNPRYVRVTIRVILGFIDVMQRDACRCENGLPWATRAL